MFNLNPEGLKPITPQKVAGILIEPPISDANPIGEQLEPTNPPSPPLDPNFKAKFLYLLWFFYHPKGSKLSRKLYYWFQISGMLGARLISQTELLPPILSWPH